MKIHFLYSYLCVFWILLFWFRIEWEWQFANWFHRNTFSVSRFFSNFIFKIIFLLVFFCFQSNYISNSNPIIICFEWLVVVFFSVLGRIGWKVDFETFLRRKHISDLAPKMVPSKIWMIYLFLISWSECTKEKIVEAS